MLDRQRRGDEEELEADGEELPESEQAMRSNAELSAGAAEARASQTMSREEALALVLTGPTVPLPHRAALEARFGVDLSDVRAHVGPDVAAALAVLGAEALTLGHDVAFATLTPSEALVAHELAHVLQQRAGGGQGEQADEQQAAEVEGGGEAGALAAEAEEATTKPGGSGIAPELRKKAVQHEDLDPAALAREGEEHGQGEMTAAAIASAIAFDDKKFVGPQRAQLLTYLRGDEVAGDAHFTEADVEKVARVQRGAGVAAAQCDGKIGDTTMAILLHAGFAFSFDDKVKVKPKDVQLIFYPGEFEDLEAWKAAAEQATKGAEGDPAFNVYRATSQLAPEGTGRIYVKWKGTIVDVIDARGGPPMKLKDGTHSADPSKQGTYNLGAGSPYRTNSWYMSQIRWGATFRETSDGEIEFLDPGATQWKLATGPKCKLAQPMQRSDFHDSSGALMTEWRLNDFGKTAWRIEGSPGLFIHTSPADEEYVVNGGTPVLSHSHGCVHVNPAERDRLVNEGFLQGGVQLVIKSYDVHLLPKDMRDEMQTP